MNNGTNVLFLGYKDNGDFVDVHIAYDSEYKDKEGVGVEGKTVAQFSVRKENFNKIFGDVVLGDEVNVPATIHYVTREGKYIRPYFKPLIDSL